MTPCSSHCACCARWKTALEAVGPERAATIEIVRTALADAAVALKLVEPEGTDKRFLSEADLHGCSPAFVAALMTRPYGVLREHVQAVAAEVAKAPTPAPAPTPTPAPAQAPAVAPEGVSVAPPSQETKPRRLTDRTVARGDGAMRAVWQVTKMNRFDNGHSLRLWRRSRHGVFDNGVQQAVDATYGYSEVRDPAGAIVASKRAEMTRREAEQWADATLTKWFDEQEQIAG